MTDKKHIPEQVASHVYQQRKPGAGTIRSRSKLNDKSEKKEATRVLQRVVTIPEADPSMAWNTFAERQARRRHERITRPRTYVKPIARSSQEGLRTSSGRIKAVRRSLPAYASSPIPMRSGRQSARRGLVWKFFSVLAGVIIITMALSFTFNSNAFRIEQVNVVGTRNSTLTHTIQRMGMQGQNIFLLNITVLKERIETSPLVGSVDLTRQWPNQITVSVVERTPVLLWQTDQGTYSVDAQGYIIAPASETTGADHLRTVAYTKGQTKGKTSIKWGPGMHLDADEVAYAVEIVKRLPQVAGVDSFELRYDGTMYPEAYKQNGRASGKGTYIVKSSNGWVAYLGGARDSNPLENKLLALNSILALSRQNQFSLATIDLRYGLRPVYTLRS